MSEKRSLNLLALSLIFVVITPGLVRTATYYVNRQHASANDDNPGTADLPWATIGHAAETLVAGDEVIIGSGVYNENIFFENSGDAVNGHIVYTGASGAAVVIDGTGLTDVNNGIVLNKSYIKLIGLEISNWNENAVWIENAAFFEMTDCLVHDVGCGIGVADGSHDFTFNRVEAYNYTLYGFDVSPSGGADSYNGTFNDCVAHTGRDRDQNVDGFALGHGTQHDFVFNRCITYDVYDGFDISSRRSTLNRCIAYNCWNGGYKLWQDEVTLMNCIGYDCGTAIAEVDWDGDPGVTTMMNCTFYDDDTFTVWVENAGDMLRMTNCILAGGDNIALAFEQRNVSNYQGDYNLFHNDNVNRAIVVGYEDEYSLSQIESGAWTTASGQDAHSVVVQSAGDIFVAPDQMNLHLLQTASAVDRGTATGAPSQDYDGNLRPDGAGYDIGAFEFQKGVHVGRNRQTTGVPESAELFQNHPNPFNPATFIDYSLVQNGRVHIDIVDMLGRTVRNLISEEKTAGIHRVLWDGLDDTGSRVSSGVYYYTMTAEGFSETRSLLLIR